MDNQAILSKITALSEEEFRYSFSNDFNSLTTLDYGCSSIVTEATILYFKIKNIPSLLKTGRRLAARVYKMYHTALSEIAKETNGHFSCISPESFLLIYPKETTDVAYAVDVARKTADLIVKTLREEIEKHSILHFSIGVDMGNIIGIKVQSDNESDRFIWIGNAIDKARAIGDECNQPFYVGISGTVYHHLDEDHRVLTKRIMGFKKHIDIWSTLTYQYENVKKHLYQTNHLISFEEEQE